MIQGLPANGTRVAMGERRGRISRTGHPPAGVIIEVRFDDDGSLVWCRADELVREDELVRDE
jgi:hypothetical protein